MKLSRSLPPDLSAERMLRPVVAAELLGCSVSNLYRAVKHGDLAPPCRLSHRVSAWRLSDLLHYRDTAAERRGPHGGGGSESRAAA